MLCHHHSVWASEIFMLAHKRTPRDTTRRFIIFVVLSPSDNYRNIIYLAEENSANNKDEIRAEFKPSSVTFFFSHFKQQSPNGIQLIRQ